MSRTESPTPPHIIITAGSTTLEAGLNESDTARQVWEALPLEPRPAPGATKSTSRSR